MEEDNKYWIGKGKRICIFCEKGEDKWEHFLKECNTTKDWFWKLGRNMEERMNRIWNEELDSVKERIIRNFCKEKNKERNRKG